MHDRKEAKRDLWSSEVSLACYNTRIPRDAVGTRTYPAIGMLGLGLGSINQWKEKRRLFGLYGQIRHHF